MTAAPKRKAPALTIAAHDVPNFAAFDPRLRSGAWHMALVGGAHRESDALDRSNARVIAARLAKVDPDADDDSEPADGGAP